MRAALLSLMLVGWSGAALSDATPPPSLRAPMIGNDGSTIGEVALTAGPSGTVMRIMVLAGKVLPGWHGMHFHAVADCADLKNFETAKAHVNHGGRPHGLLNPKGPDAGDLPNVHAAANGAIEAEVFTAQKLAGRRGLADANGSALILHAGADDHVSQPVGNAGARIGCAAIKQLPGGQPTG